MQISGMFWRTTRFERHTCLQIKAYRSSLTISSQYICICEPLPHLPVPAAVLWVMVMLSHRPVTAQCHWDGTTATQASAQGCVKTLVFHGSLENNQNSIWSLL